MWDKSSQSSRQHKANLSVDRKSSPLQCQDAMSVLSMTELYDQVFDIKPPLIEGLLYPGVYLFVGAPKLGKSFFMAQLGYHVSTGQALWDFPVRQGTVLYLALEDNYARLQRRLYQMFGTKSTGNLFFSVEAKSVRSGLEEQMESFLKAHPGTRLIIIDTLQKIRENGQEGSSYGNDYEIITKLKQFADRTGLCLLLVHHTRKQQAEDSFDMISGTNGLLGAADGAWVLHKKARASPEAILEVSGRDQQDRRFKLLRNPENLQWVLSEDETESMMVQTDPILEGIDLLLAEGDARWQGSSSDLAIALGSGLTSTSITRKLNTLAGELYDTYKIRYNYLHGHAGRLIRLERVADSAWE